MTIPKPTHLKVEYLESPQGIETRTPRFSWLLHHPGNGQSQTAYQLLVCSSIKDLENGKGSLWDSGQVKSTETVNVPYGGSPLTSHSLYFWCVRWWDSDGKVSPYSEISQFGTAFINGGGWEATWLSMKEPESFESNFALVMNSGKFPQNHAIYLRRAFNVKQGIKYAQCCVSGLGYYELHINGQKVGDHLLDPGQTDYSHYALYSTFDVTELLKQGSNGVGIILGNGRHIEAYEYGKPRGIMQLFLEYEDGSSETVLTDSHWKASHGPIMENGMYFGERYDARREMPGWDTGDFNDVAWDSVDIVDGPALKTQVSPPIRATHTLKPKKIFAPQPGLFIYDFGQNFTGWVRLSVTGPEGTEVTLRFAELIRDDHTLHRSTLRGAETTETYILSGQGQETYEPHFTYHGFRYVEITGYPGVPTFESIEGIFVHSDVPHIGDLHCSNDLINRIHRNIYWGQLSNLMSIPTDCPQRDERMGWMGDAALAAEESFYNFDMVAFYTKYLDDIRCAQGEDGGLADVIPPYWKIAPADPAWGSAYITIAWFCYQFTGDKKILEDHFDAMRKYVEFLENSADDFIINQLGKFGDWCPPGSILPTKTPIELTSTWYFYHDTTLLARIATALNRRTDVDKLTGLAENIKDAFNAAFLRNGRYKTVRNGILSSIYLSQTSQALPLYFDMVPEAQKPLALDHLKRAVVSQSDCHVDTGIIGTRYLFDVLTDNGLADIAYKVATQRTYPGFGYMIEEGATTLWERWEKLEGSGMNSHNHIMLGSIDAWFYRTLAGLSPLEAGWKKVGIKPHIPDDLNHCAASVKTVRGEVKVSWLKEDDQLTLTVSIPVNLTAQVSVPMVMEDSTIQVNGTTVWEKGRASGEIEGLIPGILQKDRVSLNVVAGFYRIEVN